MRRDDDDDGAVRCATGERMQLCSECAARQRSYVMSNDDDQCVAGQIRCATARATDGDSATASCGYGGSRKCRWVSVHVRVMCV